MLGSKAADLLAPKADDLTTAIKGAFAKNAPPISVPESGAQAGQTIALMIKNGEPDSAIQAYAAQHGFGGGVDEALAHRAQHGRYTPEVVLNKAPITPSQVKDALGSRATRTGIESNPGLTPEVAARTNELRGQGVPDDQAIRQAHIEAVGGNPLTADVTRDPSMMRATKEGAKLDTPEGQALATQAANNNASVIGATKDIVNGYGGATGDAMETAANSLSNASNAERKGVTAAYTSAAAQSGEAKTTTKALADVLNDPKNIGAVTSEGRTFIRGMKSQVKVLNPQSPDAPPIDTGLLDVAGKPIMRDAVPVDNRISANDLEQLRQTANDASSPTAPRELKALIVKVKQAIDSGFSDIGDASASYKSARASHQAWAAKYEDQPGVANLIKKDLNGNFVNADNWRSADGIITKTSDADFVQVARQLKANGDKATLSKFKAQIVQGAYEASTGKAAGTAVDQLGNSTMRGSQFHAYLNNVGKAKLDALFSSDQQAQLAAIGHAASHINEAVPGTVNTSNTAATLANALARAKNPVAHGSSSAAKIANGSITALGAALGHLSGVGALEGGEIGAAVTPIKLGLDAALNKRAASKSAADLAQALRGASSPEVARAAENDNAIRELAKTIAKARAGAVAGRSGAVVGQRRREGN